MFQNMNKRNFDFIFVAVNLFIKYTHTFIISV